jgi:hypothetical protein
LFASHIFVCIDPSFGYCAPHLLWETMIFGGPHDAYKEQYNSRKAALAGHQRALALASDKKAGA